MRRVAYRCIWIITILSAAFLLASVPACYTLTFGELNLPAMGQRTLVITHPAEMLNLSYGSISFSGIDISATSRIKLQISYGGLIATSDSNGWKELIESSSSVCRLATVQTIAVSLVCSQVPNSETCQIIVHPAFSLAIEDGATLKQNAPADPYGWTTFPDTPFGENLFADPAQLIEIAYENDGIVLLANGGKPECQYSWELTEAPEGALLSVDSESALHGRATLTAVRNGEVTITLRQEQQTWSSAFPFYLTVTAENPPPNMQPADRDGDGTSDIDDGCPDDPLKTQPGLCGCGTADTDGDHDGTPDCDDDCPNDPLKVAPGDCGCGHADEDANHNGVSDCLENDVTLTIRVTHEGEPIELASVQVQGCCPPDGNEVCSGLTGANGSYICGDVAPGTQLWVYAFHDIDGFMHGQTAITVVDQGGGAMLAEIEIAP